ncbi:MAG: UbiX family flavin prenyltransferase [Clostridiales bacterium]|nr:UbiX family flavin prenyltransferase [Clostridiales bacterium]
MKRIVIGISGASGFPLATCLLNELKKMPDVETHLVYTYGAELTAKQESGYDPEQIRELADVCYDNYNIGAAIASGTFLTEGMIILPCSMKTLSGIAHGFSENLLLRAADVTIKEQRKLVLAVRESPLSSIHLENMLAVSRLHNVFVMPPLMTYYMNGSSGLEPITVSDMERHMVGKMLQPFGIEMEGFRRWT